jgi:hypothetical protein
MKIKKFMLAIGLLFVAGCTTHSSEKKVLSLTIECKAPRNDIIHNVIPLRGPVYTNYRTDKAGKWDMTCGRVFDVAAYCKAQDNCAQTLVYNHLDYRFEPEPGDKLHIIGKLISDYGRHLEVHTVVGFNKTSVSSTLPDEIKVLDTGKSEAPFDVTLGVGDDVIINGFAESSVQFTVNEVRTNLSAGKHP